jgi:hypothetical protein
MAHVVCPECGEEVSEPLPTCAQCDAPPVLPRAAAPQSVAAQRHKTHPITWVATAAIIPLLCWDAWQTYKEARLKMSVDVKFDHAPRESGYVPRLDEQLPEHASVVGAWMRAGEAARSDGAQVAHRETATFARGPFNVKRYFVAQSGDGGRTWKFFDGVGVTPENIRVVLPNYHGQPLPQVAVRDQPSPP